MMPHPSRSRSSRKGFALLLVLVGAVLVAGLAATLRTRGAAQAMVLSRVEEAHRIALGRASVVARLATGIGTGAIPPNGTPVRLTQDGRDWEVRLLDVEGLVDLYLAPPEVLALLTGDGDALARQRDVAFAALIPGNRFASEEHTLARFGFDATQRAALEPLVTQRAQTGEINPALAPSELIQAGAPALSRIDTAGGVLAEVAVRPLP